MKECFLKVGKKRKKKKKREREKKNRKKIQTNTYDQQSSITTKYQSILRFTKIKI